MPNIRQVYDNPASATDAAKDRGPLEHGVVNDLPRGHRLRALEERDLHHRGDSLGVWLVPVPFAIALITFDRLSKRRATH
jgi:hypothetical protein